MNRCAVIAGGWLFAMAPVAMAQQAAPAKAQVHAARAKLDASRGQAAAEHASVGTLKARVDALEAASQADRQALDDRDRKIAELQRQLDATRKP